VVLGAVACTIVADIAPANPVAARGFIRSELSGVAAIERERRLCLDHPQTGSPCRSRSYEDGDPDVSEWPILRAVMRWFS